MFGLPARPGAGGSAGGSFRYNRRDSLEQRAHDLIDEGGTHFRDVRIRFAWLPVARWVDVWVPYAEPRRVGFFWLRLTLQERARPGWRWFAQGRDNQ